MKFCPHPLTILLAFLVLGLVWFCFAPPSLPLLVFIFILPRGGRESGTVSPLLLHLALFPKHIERWNLIFGFLFIVSASFSFSHPLFYHFFSSPLTSSPPFSFLLSLAFRVSSAFLLLPPQISLKLYYSEWVVSFQST